MKLAVKILAEDCKFKHACLDNDGHILCKVEECVNEKFLFVECKPRECNKSINFGNDIVCFCPTRKEIFQNYNM